MGFFYICICGQNSYICDNLFDISSWPVLHLPLMVLQLSVCGQSVFVWEQLTGITKDCRRC